MEAKITVGIGGLSRGRNLLKPMLNNGRLLATRSSLAHHSIIIHPRIETESILILRSLPSFIASGRRCSKSVDVQNLLSSTKPPPFIPVFSPFIHHFFEYIVLAFKIRNAFSCQNYRFLSEGTSHNLSPGRWGRGGSGDFQGITWFSGGTVAADHSSPAEC